LRERLPGCCSIKEPPVKKKTKDTDYLFLSAYVHACQARLSEGPVNKSEIFSELSSMAPDSGIVDFFRLKYDYHNAKVLIKSTASGVIEDRLLSPLGRIDAAALKSAYLESGLSGLPAEFSAAVLDAKDTLARTGDPRLSDFILDRAYVSELLHTARTARSEFLQGYARLFADCVNLRSVVRMLKSGVERDKLDGILSECGTVAPGAIKAAYPETAAVLKLYSSTKLAPALHEAEAAAAGGGFSVFEEQCRAALDAYMDSLRLQCFGEQPLIYYLYTIEGIKS
jgi:V/A-type H+-transporting ATPase subunit C